MKRSYLKQYVFGFLLAGFLLFFLARKMDLKEVYRQLVHANLWILLLMPLLKLLVTYVKAYRWGYAIRSVMQLPHQPKRLYSATFISFLGNLIFPARLGELLRVQICQKNNPEISRSLALTCSVLPQIFDLLAVLVLLVLGLSIGPSGGVSFGKIALVFGAVICILLILHFFHRFYPYLESFFAPYVKYCPEKLRAPLAGMLRDINQALSLLHKWKKLLIIFGLTVCVWSLETVALTIGLTAFGIPIFPVPEVMGAGGFYVYTTPYLPALMMTTAAGLSLAFLLPLTPGALGLYQAAAIWSLALFGIPETEALATSLGMQAADFLIITIMGFYFFYQEGLSLRQLRPPEESEEQAPNPAS